MGVSLAARVVGLKLLLCLPLTQRRSRCRQECDRMQQRLERTERQLAELAAVAATEREELQAQLETEKVGTRCTLAKVSERADINSAALVKHAWGRRPVVSR